MSYWPNTSNVFVIYLDSSQKMNKSFHQTDAFMHLHELSCILKTNRALSCYTSGITIGYNFRESFNGRHISISFICKHMFCFMQLFQLEIPVSGPRLRGKCPYPHVRAAFHWDNSISSEWFLWSYPPLWKHLPTYLHIDAATLWHSCF